MTPTEMLRAHTREMWRAKARLTDAEDDVKEAEEQLAETKRRYEETKLPCSFCDAPAFVWCDQWDHEKHARRTAREGR